MSDRIRIFIRDCKIDLEVGIYEHEMGKAQSLTINVECEASAHHHFNDKNDKTLTHTIDYDALYHFIADDLPQKGHIFLLESVAEQIIAFCFQDPRIERVCARIEKTAVFPKASAGIELIRHRP